MDGEAVESKFKSNREWLSQTIGFAVLETGLLLGEALLVIAGSNYVSHRTMPIVWRSWFALSMLILWTKWRLAAVVPLRFRLPSKANGLFAIGLCMVAALCWWQDELSLANLTEQGRVSWALAVRYVLVIPLEEELLFRGVVLLNLLHRQHQRRRTCVVLSGLVFALLHLPNSSVR